MYFDSFGIINFPQDVLNKFKDKSHKIFRIQSDISITCGFYFIAFIEYIIAGKSLFDYTNLLSPNNYKKNYKIIHKRQTWQKKNASLDLTDETRNYLLEEIKHNELMSKEPKKVFATFN